MPRCHIVQRNLPEKSSRNWTSDNPMKNPLGTAEKLYCTAWNPKNHSGTAEKQLQNNWRTNEDTKEPLQSHSGIIRHHVPPKNHWGKNKRSISELARSHRGTTEHPLKTNYLTTLTWLSALTKYLKNTQIWALGKFYWSIPVVTTVQKAFLSWKLSPVLPPCSSCSDAFRFVRHRPLTLKGLPRWELMWPLIFPLPLHADGVRVGGGARLEEDARLVTGRWAGSANPALLWTSCRLPGR